MMSSEFEYLTLSRSQLVEWPAVLAEIRSLVLNSRIKVVDIRRHQDHLIIVFRRLYPRRPDSSYRTHVDNGEE
jgi:hypothetical protein